MKIRGKVFVVTGGGNGIGRQVALRLLELGAHVAIADLNADGLEQTRALSGSAAIVLSTHIVNVADADAVAGLVDDVIAAHGHVDGVVNVAGIIHRFVHVDELSAAERHRIVDVNFWGTVNVSLAFLPSLRARSESSLVNISSLSALLPFAGQSFYSATKGAVKMFSEALYQELRATNVSVTTVFPGNISTNISGNSGVAALDASGRKVRATTPEQTAREIVAGIERERFRVLIGSDARLLDKLVRIAPHWATNLIGKQMDSVLPARVTAGDLP